MLDFQRKKDVNLITPIPHNKENSFLFSEPSKNIYDYILKHDNQINDIKMEMYNLKSQLIELAMKSSFSNNSQINGGFISNTNNENNNLFLSQIKKFKNEIKKELLVGINDMVDSNMKKFEENFENLKEEIFVEIDKKNINQKLMINNEEKKSNLENIILKRVNDDKIEINNTTESIIKRIDNFDMDFDRLILSLKNQFSNSADTINQLQISKVSINEYEKQIEIINQNIESMNNKIENILNSSNKFDNNININNSLNKKILVKEEEEYGMKQELNIFKNELYNNIEKINLKMLNELKNQADDIKLIYQQMHNLRIKQNSNTTISHISPEINDNHSIPSNIISYINSELSKKSNLDQLNFALETQAKLNEAFSSASKISRFCWDSEGLLKDEKFIKWSIQNINTALDVFKWEKNTENITILKNGVYKVVFGLIGLESKKNFGIIFNNEENIVAKDNLYENENEEKGNIQFMVKYIACVENTNIKAIIFNNNDNDNSINDNSEEAFLEITKII